MLERFISLATKYPFDVITYLTILIPIVTGTSMVLRLKKELRLVIVFFFVDFCCETISLFSMLKGGTTLYMADIRASLNIALVSGIYSAALIRQNQKKAIVGIGVVFFIFSIILYSGDDVAPWSQTAFRVYAMGAALLYYTAILSDLNLKKIQHHSMFWMSAGLLFYAGGTLFIMLFNQYLYDKTTPNSVFDLYWNFMQALYILFCLLASIGFWVSKQDKDNYFGRNYFSKSALKQE